MGKILLLLLSGAKFGKLFTTGGTMLVSLVVYAFIFGWKYAAGFILLLFVDEMGHYIAARQRGLDVGAPTFIPFVGAWINLKDLPHDAETEAYVGLGGPLLGSVGAIAVYFAARESDSGWLLAVAYSGFFLNLFNLIPFGIFDGGAVWRSARFLRHGGGPGKALFIYALYFGTALVLVLGMIASHVPQHRL